MACLFDWSLDWQNLEILDQHITGKYYAGILIVSLFPLVLFVRVSPAVDLQFCLMPKARF